MKKFIALLMALVFSLCLISCGGDSGDNNPPEVNPDLNVGEDGAVNLPIIDYVPQD